MGWAHYSHHSLGYYKILTSLIEKVGSHLSGFAKLPENQFEYVHKFIGLHVGFLFAYFGLNLSPPSSSHFIINLSCCFQKQSVPSYDVKKALSNTLLEG